MEKNTGPDTASSPSTADPNGCQEASPKSSLSYIPCNRPATRMVKTKDPDPYRMCDTCADHNVRNRGAEDIGQFIPTASIPPDFMDKVEKAQSKAEETVAREEKAQNKDGMAMRAAAITKATSRLLEQAEYLGRIDKVVAANLPEFIAGNPLGQALDLFVSLEDQINAADSNLKSLRSRIATAREVAFPARLDAEDCKTTTSKDTGNRITRTARIFASTKGGPGLSVPDGGEVGQNNYGIEPGTYSDLVGCPLGYVWLKQNDLGALIKPTVNASSLSASAKELMENGRELPEVIFSVHTKDSVSITKGKGKR